LQPVGPDLRARTPMYGTVDWKKASQSDDQWVIPCDVNLISSREMRLVSFRLGEEWIEFNLPLSPNPTSANKAWSEWRADGFTREAGKPPVEGYTYRVRVKGIQEIRDEQADAGRAFWQEREDAARAIPADAPIERWLPLFEDPDGSPADYRWGGADRIERHAVAARVLELAPSLESKDRTVVRQAVFALGSLRETPKDLVPPLLTAGRITLDLIHEAQTPRETPDLTGADPGRKALQYFDMWSRAMRNAGASDGEFRKVLADVRRDAEGKGGDLSILANKAKDIEDALPPSGK